MFFDENVEAVTLAYDEYIPDDVEPDLNPIIFIHGLFWTKAMYEELGHSLSQATKRKVFTIDLRCHNESPFCERCDMKSWVADVIQFMADHELKKVVLVCHSISSTIGYLVTLKKPESVEKLVLIDHPPFISLSEKLCLENASTQFHAQNRYLKTLDPKMSLLEAKEKILNPKGSYTKEQEIFLKKVAYDLDKDCFQFKWKTDIKFLMQKLADGELTIEDPFGSSNHEILVIACPNSLRITDERFKAIKRHNPNSRLEIIEGTTHILMLEKMDEFIDIVKIFLSS